MKRREKLLMLGFVFATLTLAAQTTDSTVINAPQNSAEALLNSKPGLGIGGYGEVHYNQPLVKKQRDLGGMDVHRLVMFMGYNFGKNTQFVSEIEFEHVNELWVEQAFLQHKINKFINFRAGLMLVPMGITNEYHEPTSFNGVERPIIDSKIAPSTWREIGAGFSGTILPISMRYQVYVMNGMSGYSTSGLFNGSSALRNGRQKGAESYISAPNYTMKAEYFGLKNLTIGLAGYFGKSQSKLYDKLNKDSVALNAKADSSVVGISMVGIDARYGIAGLEFKGQYYYTALSNTAEYNRFTKSSSAMNDLGSSMIGYYLEVGYNVFRLSSKLKQQLIPFVRYEFYNTHQSVETSIAQNKKYKNQSITTGITYKLHSHAVLKADFQFNKSAADDSYSNTMNAGFGITF